MNQTAKILTVIIILMSSGAYAFAAQSAGAVGGTVYTSDGIPLGDVYVIITSLDRTDVTDTAGFFYMDKIPPGIYGVDFRHIGYLPVSISGIQILENAVVILDSVILKPQIFSTGSVIVTARRGMSGAEEIPGGVNIVSAEQIKIRQAQTSAEALREETGVFVQKTNHGGGSAIIRGLSSNQILLLVDGIRLNNSVYRLGNHQYLTTIDPLMADRIEVMRGPGSVMYGSDALGGAVNVISSQPVLFSPELKTSTRLFGRYSTADAEKTGRMELNLSYKKLAVKTGLSYKYYSDLRRGASGDNLKIKTTSNGLIQRPSGFDAWDTDVQLRLGISPLQQLSLMFQHSRQNNVPRYDKYENEGYKRWVYEPQIRSLLYAKYEQTLQSGFLDNFVLTTSWQRQEEGRRIQQNETVAEVREIDDVQTLGFIAQATGHFNNHRIGIGTEIYTDDVASQRNQAGENVRGRYPDGARYTSLGIFLQDNISLTNRWQLTLGGRISYLNTKFSLPESALPGEKDLFFQALTGSFGSVYNFTENLSGKVNIAQGFRAPNLSDLAKLGESKGDVYEVPNRDLDAEKMIATDIEIEWKTGNLSVQVGGYYSFIKDLLASADDTYNGSPVLRADSILYKVKSKQNIGRAEIHGVEAQFNWQLTHAVFFSGTATYTYGQNITQSEPVGGIPPLFGRIGLLMRKQKNYAELLMRFAGNQSRLSADDLDDPRIPEGGTPGWTIFTLRGGYKLSNVFYFRLALENIFDLNYREHGSGINGPGRNLIVSMQADF